MFERENCGCTYNSTDFNLDSAPQSQDEQHWSDTVSIEGWYIYPQCFRDHLHSNSTHTPASAELCLQSVQDHTSETDLTLCTHSTTLRMHVWTTYYCKLWGTKMGLWSYKLSPPIFSIYLVCIYHNYDKLFVCSHTLPVVCWQCQNLEEQ